MFLNNLLSIILCFVLAVSFGFVSAQRCGNSLFFRPNSAYDTNRRLVLSTLASQVSSRNGYYNVSVGEGPGKIYALGLCIPGTDPEVCSDCIQTASDGLLESCPNQTNSWDWRADKTLCFVRYSNISFFNRSDLEPTQAEYDTGMYTGNVTTYTRVWNSFMESMITRVGQSPSRYLADVSPRIDFGMARNFRVDQTEDTTGRVVGTFGYMPPEYVTCGHFSTKSDVYSFGVLILEIICGKKNSSFYHIDDDSGGNMVTHVWRLWNNEAHLDLIDPAIRENYEKDEVIRSIHIGLLCVQETPAHRPEMSTIFQMLTNSSTVLPMPRAPGCFLRNRSNLDPLTYGSEPGHSRFNSVSYSIVTPR
ncbi:hypothetical protein F2Q68_00002312 [Brassica cretica]|uniref:Gnk2-homologous domain-containing protein n=1 Tax=Brassica cretica TaxID=69181 RepID=A0A8S9JM38_BRACR|nr:hypothetical protein F2Q68_00002312 [Brassica cretica]